MLRDNHRDVPIVRPTSYGYAQPDREHKSRRRKRPLGFIWPDPKPKPKGKDARAD